MTNEAKVHRLGSGTLFKIAFKAFEKANVDLIKREFTAAIELCKCVKHTLVVLHALDVCTSQPAFSKAKEVHSLDLLLLDDLLSDVFTITWANALDVLFYSLQILFKLTFELFNSPGFGYGLYFARLFRILRLGQFYASLDSAS